MASPSHCKRQAERYLNKATEIDNYQNEVEFSRQLLSNIRQARIGRAMLEVGNYNQAIKYWNKFFTDIKESQVSNCDCYGIHA